MFLGPANEDSPKSAAKRLEQKAEGPAESIYEKQRQYYFGGENEEDDTSKMSTGKKFYDDGKPTDSLEQYEDSSSGLLDGLEPSE